MNASIIKKPVSNEKTIRMMESENKLVFSVDRRASKVEIKQAIEELYKAKVVSVNTHIVRDGSKRAIVKFSMDSPAIDVATNLGLI